MEAHLAEINAMFADHEKEYIRPRDPRSFCPKSEIEVGTYAHSAQAHTIFYYANRRSAVKNVEDQFFLYEPEVADVKGRWHLRWPDN